MTIVFKALEDKNPLMGFVQQDASTCRAYAASAQALLSNSGWIPQHVRSNSAAHAQLMLSQSAIFTDYWITPPAFFFPNTMQIRREGPLIHIHA